MFFLNWILQLITVLFVAHYYATTAGSCPNLTAPAFGTIDDSEGWLAGASVYFTCDPYTKISGPSERTCQSNNTWTGDQDTICECGEAFNGSSGDIYSPNWGNGNYHDGHNCTWTIEVPAGNVIKADLVTFSLDTSSDDTVTFYDGSLNNDDVLWTATGLRYPDVVVSTQAQITIVFASDLTLNATGFHIYWSAVPCGNFATMETVTGALR